MFKQLLHRYSIQQVTLLSTESPLHQRIVRYLTRNRIEFSTITSFNDSADTALLILPLSMQTITPVSDILQQMLQLDHTPLLVFATDFPVTTRFKKRFSIAGIIGILELTEHPRFIKVESHSMQSNPTASLNALIYTTENLISRNIYKILSQNILYNALIKLHPSIICITTIEGTIIYFRANREYLQRNNNIKKVLYGKKINDFATNPDSINNLFTLINKNIEQRESEITFCIDNNTFNLLVTGEKIQLYNNFDAYLLIGINITTQRKTEDLLISSELKYRTLVENLPDGLSLSKGEMLLYANPQFFKLFHYPSDTLMTDIDFHVNIHMEDWDTLFPLLHQSLDDVTTISIRGITNDKKQILLELHIVSFQIDNSLYHQIYWRDITQTQKLLDTILHSERLSAIGELASGITHEFNNILTSIQGYIQYTINNPDDAEANKKAFKVIEKMGAGTHHFKKSINAITKRYNQ